MGILLGTALVFVTLGVLIYPFVNKRGYAPAADTRPERLRVARRRVYRQIADLESDFRAGELTDNDYDSQLLELRVAAAEILRQESQLGSSSDDDDPLEREIEAARRGRSGMLEGGDTLE